MRLFAQLGLSLLMLCGVSVGLARGLAQVGDPPPHLAILLPDPHCPAPCWQGIHTDGMTHQATVERILSLPQAETLGLLEWQFLPDSSQHRYRVRLEQGRHLFILPMGVRLGDILATLGWADWHIKGSAVDQIGRGRKEYLQLAYQDHQLLVTVLINYWERVSMESVVYSVNYPAGVFTPAESAHPWQGFIWVENTYPYFGYAPRLVLN